MTLLVIIPTLDEELHLARCLDSIRGLDARVIVVDSGSTDDTVSLARAADGPDLAVDVVEHEYDGPAHQKNWALDELEPTSARDAGRVAKAYSARAARIVCETAVQVHGGMGYIWESEINRLYRGNKLLEIGAGTSEVRKIIIAEELLRA